MAGDNPLARLSALGRDYTTGLTPDELARVDQLGLPDFYPTQGRFAWSAIPGATSDALRSLAAGGGVPEMIQGLPGYLGGLANKASQMGAYAVGANPLTTDQIIPMAADVTMGLAGSGMPMAEAGALGSAGGRLFHGSPQAGLKELIPSERGPLGPGVYTSPVEGVAGRYGSTTYQLPNETYDVFRGSGHRSDAEYHGWKSDVQRLKDAVEPDKQDVVHPVIDKMWSSDGYPMFARLAQIYGSQEAAQNLFKRAGFQGLSGLVDGPETLLFGKVPTNP